MLPTDTLGIPRYEGDEEHFEGVSDDGESNFLPVGTTLHRIAGFEPDARLAYWSSELEEWQGLTPQWAF